MFAGCHVGNLMSNKKLPLWQQKTFLFFKRLLYLVFMDQDFAYQYFQEALLSWIDSRKAQNKAPQKELADLLKVNKSTVNRYVNDTRGGVSFDKQVMIANACGKHYLDFLIFGKKIFETKHSKLSSPESKSETKAKTESEIDTGENEEVIESQKKMIAILENQVAGLEKDKARLLERIEKLEAQLEGTQRVRKKGQSQTRANPVEENAQTKNTG